MRPDEIYHYHNIIGKSESMQKIYRLLETITTSESSVLISGETGTGKELVAQAIHTKSKRKEHPFVIMDCSVLNKNLIESELFGHVKGAFTGAATDKQGIFELADRGTLFLDELGEMSLDTQVKLLRALEGGTFRPVGSSEEKVVDVRIIAATNKDLKTMISTGNFREDLYYRLNVITFSLPPLRERKEDIPFLLEHFIRELNVNNGCKRHFSREALAQLIKYSFPGNVRELKNIVERTFMLCENTTINREDLPREVKKMVNGRHLLSCHAQQLTLNDIKREAEKEALIHTLKCVKGNKLRAARLLNISRSTLYAKIEEHRIEC